MDRTGGCLLAAFFLFAGVYPAIGQSSRSFETPVHVLGVVVGPDGAAQIVCRQHVGAPVDITEASATNRIARELFEPIPDLSALRWHDEDAFVAPRTTPDKSGEPSAAFQVEYTGFSSEARAAFQYAVDLWSTRIESSVTIQVEASWSSLDENVLGSAGPTYFDDADSFSNPFQESSWFVPALANAIRGTDDFPNEGDVRANFNSDFDNWYFGLDGQTPSGMIDFVTVVLHEIGHGLGFLGSMKVDDGADAAECDGTEDEACWGFSQYPDVPVIYDRFAEDSGETLLINTSTYPNPSTELGDVLQGGPVLFAGDEAVATYAGARPPLYAPTEWEKGSSYSHLDEATFRPGDPSALMTPSVATSEAIHDPGPIGCAVFADIEWTTTSDCGTLNQPETPAVPVLAAPPDGAQDLEPPVTFLWREADRADTYELQVSVNRDFPSPDVSVVGISDTSYTVEQLESDTKYYWRVRSFNAEAVSEYSSTYDFTTEPPPPPTPAAPTLTSPGDGATAIATDVTLQWEASADASSYEIQLAKTEVFDAPVVDATTENTSFDVLDLDVGTTYHWRVRGVNDSGSGTWSDVFSFTTRHELPPPPDVIGPKDGATGVDTSLVLDWTDVEEAATYRVQVATDSGFADPFVDVADLDTTSIEIAGLVSDATYFWRVRSENETGAGAWSAAFTFSTNAAVPVVPDTIHPADGATDVSIPTEFSWSEAVEADHYEMQVALDTSFADLAVDSSRVDTTHLLIDSLEPAMMYFWRVRAINEVGRSVWSVGAEFKTVVDTTDDEEGAVSDQFGFTAAYPNPFHDRITFDFVLPQAMHVRVDVFDMQGRRVGRVLDEGLGAGPQEVSWSPTGLPSGVYVSRLEAESRTSVRKIVLIGAED